MPINPTRPSDQQPNPYLPPGPQPLIFENWQGINTSTTRAGVDDKQAYWLDSFFPIAPRNLRTMYGVGSALYTAGVGRTIIFFTFYNLGSTPYMAVFLDNGSVVQVNTTSGATTTIMAAATITTPTIVNVGTSQWGNQYLIIVANQTNGYWLWDGVNLYTAGTAAPVVTMTNVGSGYPASVTVTLVGGHGTGSSLTGSVVGGQIISVSVVNPGSGYLATDALLVAFAPAPSGGTGATITASISGTTLNTLSIVSGGSGYSSNPSLVFSGGGIGFGVPAAALAIVTAGTITNTSITYRGGGNGYSSNPTVTITDIATTASATAQLMPFGVQGTAVETYQGRVWVAKVATIFYTAPGSFSDFSAANAGGNFTSADSFLQISYTQLINTNGFLWLIGDSSVNTISGVQVSGSPPSTSFTNQNVDPQVGTPYPASVETFGRDILIANSFGVYVVYGGVATKISEPLDGVWNSVSNFGGIQLSSAQAQIFGKKTWMVLARIVDPISGSTVNKLFCWYNKMWFPATQDMTLTYIKHQELNSVIAAYGTDGTTIKPLFNTASVSIQKIAQSKLWDAPGGYLLKKATGRFWCVALYNSTLTPNIIVSIDNQDGVMAQGTGASITAALTGGTVSSLSIVASGSGYSSNPSISFAGGAPATAATATPGVVNGSLTSAHIVTAGTSYSATPTVTITDIAIPYTITGPVKTGYFIIPPMAVGQVGELTGMTIKTNAADMSLVSAMMDDKVVGFRG